MSHEPEEPLLTDDDPDGTREWRKLRGSVRHQTVGMLGEIFALLRILLQDAVILVAGFAVEFAFEHWLHSEQPFFKLAINISSAMFLLLYGVMVTVHVVHYVREQFGSNAANLTDRWLPWGLAAAGVMAAVVLYNTAGTHGGESASGTGPVTRLAITLPPGQHLAGLDQPAIAISPDGKNLVYVASQSRAREQADTSERVPAQDTTTGAGPLADARGSVTQLYLRPLDSNEAKPIAGTEGASGPFFSPDGQWIGFFADGKLKKVSINGGAPVTLASAPNPAGASWSSNGTLGLQPTLVAQGLQRVSQEGGALEPLTSLKSVDYIHRWPEFLPNTQEVLFSGSSTSANWDNARIAVQQPRGESKNLAQGTQPRYAASGHLLYMQSGTLMAAPFDTQRLALSGSAFPAIGGLIQSTQGAGQYSISSTGTLAYLAGGVVEVQSRLVWVGRNGEEQTLPAAPHNYSFPRVSPDGRRVAIGIAEQETQVWVYDISRDNLTRLTFESNFNANPTWAPDGKRIAFHSYRSGPRNLFWQPADGTGGAERLTTSDAPHSPNSFSPDGQLLAYRENNPQTGFDIWVLNLKDRKTQPFLKTPSEDSAPKFSPDGKWLSYSSDESGRREIYVQSYPGPGGKWQISTDGGQEPVWNPKGGELFFRSGSKMMAVDIDTKSGFAAGAPRMLFDGPYLPTTGSLPYYDVSPDGQRFLMLKPVESQASAPTQINIVLNWFEELKQKVPVKQ